MKLFNLDKSLFSPPERSAFRERLNIRKEQTYCATNLFLLSLPDNTFKLDEKKLATSQYILEIRSSIMNALCSFVVVIDRKLSNNGFSL